MQATAPYPTPNPPPGAHPSLPRPGGRIKVVFSLVAASLILAATCSCTSFRAGSIPTADGVFSAVTNLLCEGRQAEAELVLQSDAPEHPQDQRLAFIRAVCLSSRWMKSEASAEFERVVSLGPATPHGTCARLILDILRGGDDVTALTDLIHMAIEFENDPFLNWAIGIQCRDHYHRTRKTDFSERGMVMYFVALKHLGRGPVMVHHTLANILSDELGRHDEALVHRRAAVSMERATWSLQGLAGTLSFLGQFDEANTLFYEILRVAPNSLGIWHTYADSLRRAHRHEECIEAAKQMLRLDPNSVAARIRWAQSLEALGSAREAIGKYREALELDPSDDLTRKAIRRLEGDASP